MKKCLLIIFISQIILFGFAQQKPDTLNSIKNTPSNISKIKSVIGNNYKKLENSKTAQKYISKYNSKVGKENPEKGMISNPDSIKKTEVNNDIQQATTVISGKTSTDSIVSRSNTSYPKGNADSVSKMQLQTELDNVEKRSATEKMAIEYINYGAMYMNLNNATKAAYYYEKGLRVAKEAQSPQMIEYALKGLARAYAQTQDIQKASLYYKQYVEMQDSMASLKTNMVMNQLQAKYELEKKQGEIQTLITDDEEKRTQIQKTLAYIEKQKQYIILIAITLILAVFLLLTLFKQYRAKKKTNEILLSQNTKIESQKKELEASLLYTKQLQEALKEDLDHYMQLALRKQMNPHFIFNALNSIQSFVLQNDKLKANIYLSKFAGLMRKVLENSQHQLITFEKELEVLKLYIELEEQRFDNKFNCIWDIENDLDLTEYKIPPLIMQPYVENAIWHGLLHKEGEKVLTIGITKNETHITCTIQDNGIGREATMAMNKEKEKNHESLGTKITQKRMDLLNSLNKIGMTVQYFDLKDQNGLASGTKVELIIPIIEAY